MQRETVNHLMQAGVIYKTAHGKKNKVPYQVKFIGEEYLEEAMELQRIIVDHIEHEDLFAPDSREYMLTKILPIEKGRMIGVFAEGKLIAYRTISFGPMEGINFVRVMKIPEHELDKVAMMASTVVHPLYRGNRLQLKLLKSSIEYLRGNGIYHIYTTISPANYPSLKTVLEAHMTVKDLKKIYGEYQGRIRFLLSRDLRKPAEQVYDQVVAVKYTEIIQQKKLLRAGYEGFGIRKHPKYHQILFGKKHTF